MAMICPECGYSNGGEADFCELCTHDLREALTGPIAHPHRVPSGIHEGPVVLDGSGTDQGTPKRSGTNAHPALVQASRADDSVGERAAAASLSGSFQLPDGLCGRLKLVVEQGLIIGEQYLLSELVMVIGRADPEHASYPDIDLSAQDNEYVHRQHAKLQFYDGASRLSIEHIGGHNQTLVNNSPVESGELMELLPDDRIRVGRVVMRLRQVE